MFDTCPLTAVSAGLGSGKIWVYLIGCVDSPSDQRYKISIAMVTGRKFDHLSLSILFRVNKRRKEFLLSDSYVPGLEYTLEAGWG